MHADLLHQTTQRAFTALWADGSSGSSEDLTGGVVHGSPAVVAEQGGVQVGVCLLQSRTQVGEMVVLLVHQHLQKVVDFLGAGRTVLVQFEPVELSQGTRDDEQLDNSVRIGYGLQ